MESESTGMEDVQMVADTIDVVMEESKNNELENKFIELANKNNELENKFIELANKNNELGNKIIELENELKNKNYELESKISIINEFGSKNNELESIINELKSKTKKLESKIIELENINNETEEKFMELESKNEGLEMRNKKLRKNSKKLKTIKDELESNNNLLKSKNDELESNNNLLKSKNNELEIRNKGKSQKSFGSTLVGGIMLNLLNPKELQITCQKLEELLNLKDKKIDDLTKNNNNLKEEAIKYQSALGDATSFQLGSQDSNSADCSVMFLVGGFSESKYLQSRIKQKFGDKLEIAIPPNPITAIVKGACEYGLDRKIISTRVLLWSYGVEISDEWQTDDPLSRKTINGRIYKFDLMAKKGTEVDVNKEFSSYLGPVYPNQTGGTLNFFYTTKYDATYCDEPEMKKLGSLYVDMPDIHLGLNRSVQVTLRFGSMEIVATAKNITTGKVYRTTFKKIRQLYHSTSET
ncbi:9592_t:CDS:2 [Entrophospora sp. SA101]|nr:9592_t:CDS:2 [Entrophospora sp. SA101]